MKDLIKVYTTDLIKRNLISIEWGIIDKCQHKCSYCSSADYNKNSNINYNMYKIGVHKLKNINSKFRIDLVGGEPMLHKNIKNIVDEITKIDNCIILDMCSNMKKNINEYLNLDYSKLTLTASYHIEYHDGFLEKCLSLTKQNIPIEVNINLYPESDRWSKVLDVINYCKHNNIKYGYNLLHSTPYYDPNYSNEFFEFYKELFKEDSKYIIHEYKNRNEIYSETDIIKHNISYKNMKCSPKQFTMNLDNKLFNDCTGIEYKGFDMNNLIKEIKCPLDICKNQIKFHYEKTI
jgi:MoaA/NifB/PqqE/SkfB family radical SAM enzyme